MKKRSQGNYGKEIKLEVHHVFIVMKIKYTLG